MGRKTSEESRKSVIDITTFRLYLSRKFAYVRMGNVEISLLSKGSVKLKSKNASFVVNPEGTPGEAAGAFYFVSDPARNPIYEGGVVLDRPGEFEIGGVKIKGENLASELTFSVKMEGVNILIGPLTLLEKTHGKLQEHDLVLVLVDKLVDPSFISALCTSAILYFGDNLTEFAKTYLKEETESLTKFVTSKEKLPQEIVTVLLQ